MSEHSLSPASSDLRQAIDALDAGFSVFDVELRLVLANRRFGELLEFPAELTRPGTSLAALFRYNAERGEYGPGPIEPLVEARMVQARRFEAHAFERVRPDGVVLEIRGQPLAGGGMVTIYTDVTEHRQREWALEKLRAELESRVEERTRAVEEREAQLAHKAELMALVVNHMRHGVTVVNADLKLELCNQQFLDTMRIPEALGEPGTPLEALIRHHAQTGDYGPGDPETLVAERMRLVRRPFPHRYERTRPDGTTAEVIGEPTPDGGFVTTYADVTERKQAAQRLQESENRFRDFAEASSDWFFEMDAQLRFSFFSKRLVDIIGQAPEGLLGKTRQELVSKEALSAPHWQAHLADLAAHRPYRDFEYSLKRSEGQQIDVRVSAVPVFKPDGSFAGYRGAGRDITRSKQAERALRESEARLSAILESSPVGVALVSREDLRVLFCNQRLLDILGKEYENLLNHEPCECCQPLLELCTRNEAVVDHELALRRADGMSWWGLASVRIIKFGDEEVASLWVYDVTELHQARERLQQMAHQDDLTGIANRRYFELSAEQALLRAERLRGGGALISLDLDGFKGVNDQQGHAAGDALLQAIVRHLQQRLRKSDLLARLGGDEFAVLCEGLDQAAHLACAQQVIALIAEAAEQHQPGCGVTASAGVAFFQADGPGFSSLMVRADRAMYQAKAAGRAQVCVAQFDQD